MDSLIFLGLFLLGSGLGVVIGVTLAMKTPAKCVKHSSVTRRAAS